MMRDILIVSDTHKRSLRLDELISYRKRLLSKGEVLEVIFLGDGLEDLFSSRHYDGIIVHAVAGNCDYASRFSPYGEEMPISRLISVDKYKVFITHGHAFSVKQGYLELCREASRLCADIVLYGHTHTRTLEYIEKGSIRGVDRDLVLFNPGSLGDFEGSFGNLNISESGFLLSHGNYHNIIKK